MGFRLGHQESHFLPYRLEIGCRDPAIVECHATAIARPGTPEALEAAIGLCRETLEHRADNTDEAWDALASRIGQLASQAERFRIRYEDERDEDGNLVPKRRHHPAVPLRRPPRFHPIAAQASGRHRRLPSPQAARRVLCDR